MTYKKGIKLLIFLVMLIILSHCTSWHKEGVSSYSDVKPYNLPNDIGRLEKIVKNNPESSIRAKAHFQLALLYSSYKNPNPNYQQALKELEAYISLNSSGKVSEEILNWLAILRELDKIIDENQ
ncbi:MAG: hypothetical protein KAQ85_10620, partial [Thermodesulfovibrionia bacterium]|nr:hypothetical protein [Thermodesulfovibrionia bacterium]